MMIKTLKIIMMLMLCTGWLAKAQPSKLQIFKKNGKYGAVDSQQKTVIPFVYDYLYSNKQGFYWVKQQHKYGLLNGSGQNILNTDYQAIDVSDIGIYAKKAGKYALFSHQGKAVTPFKFHDLYSYGSFFKGSIKTKKGIKYALLHPSGKAITGFKYDKIDGGSSFYYGWVKVVNNKKHGYIDAKGKVIIPTKYDYLWRVNQQLIYAKYNGKYGMINTQNEVLIPFRYEKMDGSLLFNKFIRVGNNQLFGLIDTKGKEVALPIYKWIQKSYGPYIQLRLPTGKDVIMNANGQVIVSPQYDHVEIGFAQEGMIPVKQNGKWGYVNDAGEEVIAPKYDKMPGRFYQGMVRVLYQGKYGVVDTKGKNILPNEYTAIGWYNNYFFLNRDNKHGLATLTGKILINPMYETPLKKLQKGIFKAQKGGYGIIDTKNTMLLDFQYDDIKPSKSKDYYFVKTNEKWRWIHLKSQSLSTSQYDDIATVNENIVRVKVYQRYGLAQLHTGKLLTPIKYEAIYYLTEGQGEVSGIWFPDLHAHHGLIPAKLEGKWGIISLEGKEITPFVLDKIYDFDQQDRMKVFKGKSTGYIDKNGKLFLPK